MGATASRGSSPSLPAKCSLVETRSATRLCRVPDYSKWLLMPAGSALLFDTIHLLDTNHQLDIGYSVKVYPAGVDKELADSVVILAEPTERSLYRRYLDDARILIEILDGSGEERTVFDNHTATSRWPTTLANPAGTGRDYVMFVKRRELEASGCVRNDSFTVRCTLFVDVRVTRSPAEVMEALSAEASSSKPVGSGLHMLEIGSFSKLKAALPAGECVHSTQFSVGGSNWYFKVYPNGHDEDTKDVSIFVGRGRSHEPATTAEFCFKIADVKERKFMKCTFDRNNTEHKFPYYTVIGNDDSLVVRCHLRHDAELAPYQGGRVTSVTTPHVAL